MNTGGPTLSPIARRLNSAGSDLSPDLDHFTPTPSKGVGGRRQRHSGRRIRPGGTVPETKKVVSGGPAHTVAFPQAVAGLPDTIPLN